MSNPQVQQGTLNRLRGSITWNAFPQLNITASYLGEEGIRMSFDGPATTIINTLTGTVTSPEPYRPVTLTINLLKTQQLGDLYKTQEETSTLLGDGTFRSDAATLSPYNLSNMAIMGVNEISANGRDPSYRVVVRGYYQVNSTLWS